MNNEQLRIEEQKAAKALHKHCADYWLSRLEQAHDKIYTEAFEDGMNVQKDFEKNHLSQAHTDWKKEMREKLDTMRKETYYMRTQVQADKDDIFNSALDEVKRLLA